MWLESHLSLRIHPKRKQLSRLLGTSTAQTIGHLHCLWWWAFEYAEDNGDISRWDHNAIADGAEWEGDPATLVDALIKSRFLDDNPLSIHDWPAYIGKLLDRRAKNRARMQECRNRASHVQRTKRARSALPDRTIQDPTGPDKTGSEGSSLRSDPLSGKPDAVAEIIADLNTKSGKHFKPNGLSAELINARLKDGATMDAFAHIHTVKCEEWLGTEWEKVLRPSTLYRKSNFDGYANQRTKAELDAAKKQAEEEKRAARSASLKARAEAQHP